jgi:hypothetical protein
MSHQKIGIAGVNLDYDDDLWYPESETMTPTPATICKNFKKCGVKKIYVWQCVVEKCDGNTFKKDMKSGDRKRKCPRKWMGTIPSQSDTCRQMEMRV